MKVLTAYNRSIRESVHLTDSHLALVEAGRVLARRLDRDDTSDNVSASVFLKYLDALGLTPHAEGLQASGGGQSRLVALQNAVEHRFEVVNGG